MPELEFVHPFFLGFPVNCLANKMTVRTSLERFAREERKRIEGCEVRP